jgi:hypothetical protein
MLYCQLSEAGGFYETLSNLIGVVKTKPYLLWPFKDLVRVRGKPSRVIGRNANATFRDLATSAHDIGMSRLTEIFELAFRDDIRNGVSHADYVILATGLRLRNRNGGNPKEITYDDVSDALTRGAGVFQILRQLKAFSARSFYPPRTIVGRLSANFPMPWTVSFDPQSGSFGLSGSSPGPVETTEYKRQIEINLQLGGKVFSLFKSEDSTLASAIENRIHAQGFEPVVVEGDGSQLAEIHRQVMDMNLWIQTALRTQRLGC